jgi:hypothetical protein
LPLAAWLLCALLSAAPARSDDLLVGAIRWDNWTPDGPFNAAVLDPRTGADRTPFFAFRTATGEPALLGGTPETLDAEDAYAFAAGLDYWIFGYYPTTGSFGRDPAAMRRLDRALAVFASLPDRRGMRFAVQLNQSVPATDLPALAKEFSGYVAAPGYLRLADGTAPVFVYDIGKWRAALGEAGPRRFFADFSAAVRQASGVAIRLVLVGGGLEAMRPYLPPDGPFAAFTSYVNLPRNDGQGHPFAACAEAGRRFWAAARRLGVPFLPTVTTGWDYRPALAHPDQPKPRDPGAMWCEPASEAERQGLIRDAIAAAGPPGEAPMRGIVLYAWNELSEGGWLVPTVAEGTRRLATLRAALGRARRLPPLALRFPAERPAGAGWPCPPGLAPAGDAVGAPTEAERALFAGDWIVRRCR